MTALEKKSEEFDSNNNTSGKKKGFTLVELLVGMSIVGVLAGIIVPIFGKAQKEAGKAECLVNLTQLYMAAAMYAEDNNGRLPQTGVGVFGYDATPCIYNAGQVTGAGAYVKYGNIKMLSCPKSSYATSDELEKVWNAAIASGSGIVISAYTYRGKSGFPGLTQEQYDSLHFGSNIAMGKTLFVENNYISGGTNKTNHDGKDVGGIDFIGSGLRRVINKKTTDYPNGELTVSSDTSEEYTRLLEKFDSE